MASLKCLEHSRCTINSGVYGSQLTQEHNPPRKTNTHTHPFSLRHAHTITHTSVYAHIQPPTSNRSLLAPLGDLHSPKWPPFGPGHQRAPCSPPPHCAPSSPSPGRPRDCQFMQHVSKPTQWPFGRLARCPSCTDLFRRI